MEQQYGTQYSHPYTESHPLGGGSRVWEWRLLDAAITIAKCRVLVSPCRTLTHDTALVAEYLK